MLAAGIETFTNILDLPCGHGRVLRHLQHAFPRAQLTACDVNMSATEFCARTFGATPVQGNESPQKIALKGNYDLGRVAAHPFWILRMEMAFTRLDISYPLRGPVLRGA
jgi:hypothetical protein